MKRTAIILLVLCLCLTLSGCMPFASELHAVSDDYEMITPQPEPIDPVLGDTVCDWECGVTLYYPAPAQIELVPVYKTITVSAGESLEKNIIAELLGNKPSDDVRPIAPEGTALRNLYRCGGTVTVDLSVDARSFENAQRIFLMRSAIAETLLGLDGIEAVDVLVAGRSEYPSAQPFGALSREDAALTARWARYAAEADAEPSAPFQRQAVLYRLSQDGRFLIPQTETLSFENGDLITPVIQALSLTEDADPLLKAAVPYSEIPFVSAAMIDQPDGRRILRLTFDKNLTSLLERSVLTPWQMYAALTCTLTGFLPETDGLEIFIGDGHLMRAESPEGEVVFDDGILTRDLFEGMIGQTETVYMTAENGSLKALTRVLKPEDARSPRMLLAELFDMPKAWEKGVLRVVPDGLSIDDLLGVRIENGEAVLNFSAGFYAGCQRLSAQQERNLIYALVNTLTYRPDVSVVRFQIEGSPIDTLVSSVSLVSPLMRNPGLIS